MPTWTGVDWSPHIHILLYVFFKTHFSGRCAACLTPLRALISCVYEPNCFSEVTQFLFQNLQWAPSHIVSALGEEVWPHAEWTRIPTLGVELLDLQTLYLALFMKNRPFLKIPSARISGQSEASTTYAAILAGIITNMHYNKKAAPYS